MFSLRISFLFFFPAHWASGSGVVKEVALDHLKVTYERLEKKCEKLEKEKKAFEKEAAAYHNSASIWKSRLMTLKGQVNDCSQCREFTIPDSSSIQSN